jgi:hypothetical protein
MPDDAQRLAHVGALTLEAIRNEHGRLLEENASATVDVADYHRRVRRFVDSVLERGAYFDEVGERRTLQAFMDHWTRELGGQASPEDRLNLAQLELAPYREEALRELQGAFPNPFARLAQAWASAPDEAQRTSAAQLKLLEDISRSAGLRFQEGLLKEISAQLSSEPEGATLAEFCLWHLFEDPATRVGNKIRRPKGLVAFSCTSYLRDKAAALYAIQGRDAARQMMRVLTRFASRRAGTVGRRKLARAELPLASGAKFELYAGRELGLESFLLESRLLFAEGDDLALVHQSLLRQWVGLAEEVARGRERARVLRWAAIGLALVLATGAGTWFGIRLRDQQAQERAMEEASAAIQKGGTALSLRTRYQAIYEQFEYRDDRQYREMVGTAILEAGRAEQLAQLKHSLQALHESGTQYVRNLANDAIGSTIGYLARASALGDLPSYPTKPAKHDPESGMYWVQAGSLAFDLRLPEPSVDHGLVVADRGGERLAAAWADRGKVQLALYRLPQDAATSGGEAALLPQRTVALDFECPDLYVAPRIRFSPSGGIVSLECLIPSDSGMPGGGRDQWVELRYTQVGAEKLTGSVTDALAFLEANTKQLADQRAPPAETLDCTLDAAGLTRRETIRLDRVDSVYFGNVNDSGEVDAFVTTGPDGYVRYWKHPPEVNVEGTPRRSKGRCPRAQFFSDFVRISLAGRPSSVAFEETPAANYYAVYHDDPPVIRVFEQKDPRHAEVIMEHYPAAGLGTIVDMRFSRNAKCIAVQMTRPRPLTRRSDRPDVRVDYMLILDRDILSAVGHALVEDLPKVKLNGEDGADRPYARLPRYSQALNACDGALAQPPPSR